MGNSKKIKRKILFDLYSQNLEWVKENPDISLTPDFSNGYICPICFDVFFEKDLDSSSPNRLTIEHIPPDELGGKPCALSCNKCNSVSGHELDAHIIKRLLEVDSINFLPNSNSKVTYELAGNKVNGTISVTESGSLQIHFESKQSNPKHENHFINDIFFKNRTFYNPMFYPDKIFGDEHKTPSFNVKFHQTADEGRAEVALLKIAYLIAYSTFGNGFLMNLNLYKIREQIQNPDKEILPKAFWIQYTFPSSYEGINIISLPKQLQCFLVVFTLKTKSASRQFAVALPGPTEPGLSIYDVIKKELRSKGGSGISGGFVEHIPKADYLKDKKYVFSSYWHWLHFTSTDYKPRIKPLRQA